MLVSPSQVQRVRVGLLILYAFLCFTSVVIGFGFNRYPPFGYLQPLDMFLDRFARSFADPFLRNVFIFLNYLLIAVFIPGIAVAYSVVVLIMAVLALLGWVIVGIHQATGGSLLGSILIYCVIFLALAIALRRHWPAVMEGVAWIVVWVEGIWKVFFPQRVPAVAYAGSARAGNRFRSQGESAMVRKDNDDDVDLVALEKAFQHEFEPPTESARPLGMLGALKHKIKSQASAKAYKEEAEMLRGVNEVAREKLTNYQLKTDRTNAPGKRIVQFVQQKLEVIQKANEFKDYLAERAEKAKQPMNPNPIKKQYEEEFLPRQEGEIRKPLDEAKNRALRRMEAAAELKKLEKEIDSNDSYMPEEKEDLKQQVRQEFNEILGNQKK